MVLSRREVHGIIGSLDGPLRLLVLLLYGSGLRLLEALRLRVKDVDFARNQITVRGGKGDRDRATMLPAALALDLAKHLVLPVIVIGAAGARFGYSRRRASSSCAYGPGTSTTRCPVASK